MKYQVHYILKHQLSSYYHELSVAGELARFTELAIKQLVQK